MKNEVKFKPQSTPYTCVPASLAVIINSLLDTDYSDLDVIEKAGGFPISNGITNLTVRREQDIRKGKEKEFFKKNFIEISESIFFALENYNKLPENLDEAKDYIIKEKENLTRKNKKKVEENPIHMIGPNKGYRKKPTKEDIEQRKKTYDKILKETKQKIREFHNYQNESIFQEYIKHLEKELFEPIENNFYTFREGDDEYEQNKFLAGMEKTLQGRITYSRTPIKSSEDLKEKIASKNGFGWLGGYRDKLGYNFYSPHQWIVSGVENSDLYLVDTASWLYGTEPEIKVDTEKLFEAMTKKNLFYFRRN